MDFEDEPREEEEKGGGWLTTWADMMSVLLTFFIVLQAFSTINERKFLEAVQSIQRAFAIPLPVAAPGTAEYQARETTARDIEQALAEAEAEGVTVEDHGDRIVLSVDSAVLFRLGRADITPEGREVLSRIASTLRETRGRIRIEGHTCDLPVGRASPFKNNWWLSTARALTVLEDLERRGVPPDRMAAAGHGEFDPVAPNDSEESRQRNRRVEFVIEKGAG